MRDNSYEVLVLHFTILQSGKAAHLVIRLKSNYVELRARAILKSYALRARARGAKGYRSGKERLNGGSVTESIPV